MVFRTTLKLSLTYFKYLVKPLLTVKIRQFRKLGICTISLGGTNESCKTLKVEYLGHVQNCYTCVSKIKSPNNNLTNLTRSFNYSVYSWYTLFGNLIHTFLIVLVNLIYYFSLVYVLS